MKTMERPNTEPMPLSGNKDLSGVPIEIIEMREKQRREAELRAAERRKLLKEASGEPRIVSPDKRNIGK